MEWCKFNLPPCVKKILIFSAYDCESSLRLLNEEKIVELEKYISEFGRSIIDELDCCHSINYKNQKTFKFLPGHRSLLICLALYVQKETNIEKKVKKLPEDHEQYSIILQELIKTAQVNANKAKNQASYSDIIRYFCTFVYLTSGRAAYDILQQNLPIPSTKTICKFKILIKFM